MYGMKTLNVNFDLKIVGRRCLGLVFGYACESDEREVYLHLLKRKILKCGKNDFQFSGTLKEKKHLI